MTMKRNWFGIAAGLFIGYCIILAIKDGYDSGEYGSSSPHGSGDSISIGTIFVWVVIALAALWLLPRLLRMRGRFGGGDHSGRHDYHTAQREEANAIEQARTESINAVRQAQAQARAKAANAIERAKAQRAAEENRWVD